MKGSVITFVFMMKEGRIGSEVRMPVLVMMIVKEFFRKGNGSRCFFFRGIGKGILGIPAPVGQLTAGRRYGGSPDNDGQTDREPGQHQHHHQRADPLCFIV